MEKFWAVILIFVVVAAAGLMYVNQVYNPQKDSQAAMADTANQTLSAVKSDVEDSAPTTVNASSVINTVNMYCKTGNTVEIHVNTGSTHNYLESSDGITLVVSDLRKYFTKVVDRDNSGVITQITFTQIQTQS